MAGDVPVLTHGAVADYHRVKWKAAERRRARAERRGDALGTEKAAAEAKFHHGAYHLCGQAADRFDDDTPQPTITEDAP